MASRSLRVGATRMELVHFGELTVTNLKRDWWALDARRSDLDAHEVVLRLERFTGSAVTSGRGRGLVVATGARSKVGEIAEEIHETERSRNAAPAPHGPAERDCSPTARRGDARLLHGHRHGQDRHAH